MVFDMQVSDALGMLALGGAIATDVAGTFAIEHAARQRDRRLGGAAVAAFVVSLALFAFALEAIPTAVAEALFAAIGSAVVAVIAAQQGESITSRKTTALALLALGVIVLQAGAGGA
jgi:multidrug transporter EmrE-like cation transporter